AGRVGGGAAVAGLRVAGGRGAVAGANAVEQVDAVGLGGAGQARAAPGAGLAEENGALARLAGGGTRAGDLAARVAAARKVGGRRVGRIALFTRIDDAVAAQGHGLRAVHCRRAAVRARRDIDGGAGRADLDGERLHADRGARVHGRRRGRACERARRGRPQKGRRPIVGGVEVRGGRGHGDLATPGNAHRGRGGRGGARGAHA